MSAFRRGPSISRTEVAVLAAIVAVGAALVIEACEVALCPDIEATVGRRAWSLEEGLAAESHRRPIDDAVPVEGAAVELWTSAPSGSWGSWVFSAC